jgi:uncharacterized protein YceK
MDMNEDREKRQGVNVMTAIFLMIVAIIGGCIFILANTDSQPVYTMAQTSTKTVPTNHQRQWGLYNVPPPSKTH